MPEPASSGLADDAGFLAPRPGTAPGDHCFRCGVATAPGEGLCPEHNPNRLPGPSATQMHATIFGGVALGVLAFFLIARFAISGSGPFTAMVTGGAVDGAGAMSLDVRVTNDGDSDGVADCRVTRDGYPRVDDAVFRTATLASGQTVTLQQDLLPPPLGTAPYDPGRATVVCD
jgi:hypothetical protein